MSNFTHSMVLFCGDDGLPLEYNVRNTHEKDILRAMIEHGGGLCTQSDNAVRLISRGTQVLNAGPEKKILSSSYIFDCVKENYLLDDKSYQYTISVADISDISEDESEQTTSKKSFHLNITPFKESLNCAEEEDLIDLTRENSDKEHQKETRSESDLNFTLHIIAPETMKELNNSAESSESFIESSVQRNNFNPKSFLTDRKNEPLTSTAKQPDVDITEIHELNGISPIQGSQSNTESPEVNALFRRDELVFESPRKMSKRDEERPSETAVSSSQEAMRGLDPFDKLLLNKVPQKPSQPSSELNLDSEEKLSQSYTVSSSADPPTSLRPVENQAFEILAGADAGLPAPDSLCTSLPLDCRGFVKKLESEVEEILLKPSPKSLQDKITLVKYICCVEKRSPKEVLEEYMNS